MDQDRWNSSDREKVKVSLFGYVHALFCTKFSSFEIDAMCRVDICLSQDPNSHNLGTTVWDASIVLAKYLEKNAKKGIFSKSRVANKKAIELGAGISGLGGMCLALMGANVVMTDITSKVLDLLTQNVEHNLSPASLRMNSGISDCGQTDIQELDWAKPDQIARFNPPVDFIVAADCVYNEASVSIFLQTILALWGDRTVGAICNEFRSESVHSEFQQQFSEHFTIKKVGFNKMNKDYTHPLIHIYILKHK
jgi:predicted nicotinamide N-methyase